MREAHLRNRACRAPAQREWREPAAAGRRAAVPPPDSWFYPGPACHRGASRAFAPESPEPALREPAPRADLGQTPEIPAQSPPKPPAHSPISIDRTASSWCSLPSLVCPRGTPGTSHVCRTLVEWKLFHLIVHTATESENPGALSPQIRLASLTGTPQP